MAEYKYDIDKRVEPAWASTEGYLRELFVKPDVELETALQSHKSEKIPAINVSPLQGAFLYQLGYIHSDGGRRKLNILEIGTLAGYSTIHLARAAALSPEGRVITLEFEDRHAQVAKRNIRNAGLNDIVDIRVGDARELVKTLENDGQVFDLIFIDADKESYCDYWRAALKLSRKGSLIIADNVIRQGGIADPDNTDSRVLGVRKFLQLASKTPGVLSSATMTVDAKGWDGYSTHLITE